MENIGRFLMIGGVILFVVGGLVFLAAKFGIPFGHLFSAGEFNFDFDCVDDTGKHHYPVDKKVKSAF